MNVRTIAHYNILEKLGEGGMGAVYKAEDTRLSRTVALKFVRASLADDDDVRLRFFREARAVAALDHPTICTIFEIGEDSGNAFIAMSFVDGPSVATLLREGRLPIEKAVDIAIQVADGLAEAHSKGVVHRDIKPANILLTRRDVVKIVDFGLASLRGDDRVTLRGAILGTPCYMAPEQWQGFDADPVSDLWALGIVLYEMLAGAVPFAPSEGRPVSYRVLRESPRPLRSLRRDAPSNLERLVERFLAKDRDQRISSAAEGARLLREWSRHIVNSEAITELNLTAPSFARSTPTSRSDVARSAIADVPTVAVLPFRSTTVDPEDDYFADGVTEEIITGLARVGALRVVSRASSFVFKGVNIEPAEIGRKLNAKYLVTGSIRRAGNQLRLTAELLTAEDGFGIWSEVYQREIRDVFAIQEELAAGILAALRIQLSSVSVFAGRSRNAPELPAYQLYLKGLFHWNKRNQPAMERAIGFFQEAIDADPLYPQPYCGLADALIISALFAWDAPRHTMPRAKHALLKALELNPNQAEAHMSFALLQFLHEWDAPAAAENFRIGLELAPRYAVGRAFFAHFQMWNGEFESAWKELNQAWELDPLSMNIMTNRGWFLFYQHRFEEAIDVLQHTLELDPQFVRANLYLGAALAQLDRIPEALSATRAALAASPDDPSMLMWLARVYARGGMPEDAHQTLQRVESSAKPVSPLDLALPYAALNELDRAATLFEQAVADRWPVTVFLRDPRLDPLRAHPRFIAALENAGLPLL